MISEEMRKKLVEVVKAETADAKSKRTMAADAKAAGESYLSMLLDTAAQEEESHARYLHDWLQEHGMMMTEADEKAYQDMERMFRGW